MRHHAPPRDQLLDLSDVNFPSDVTNHNDATNIFNKQCPQRKSVHLTVGKFLGSGGFGSVYEGHLMTSSMTSQQQHCKGRKVAVKMIRRNNRNPHAVHESFVAEKVAMTLRHRNVVRVFGTTDVNCDVIRAERLVVMEYAGSRNLLSIINDDDEYLTSYRRLKYASDVISALYYIHKHNVVHLDVKPANILVTSNDVCKLGDFGCCKVLPDSGQGSPTTPTNSYLTGTLAYRSPELLKGEYPTCAADIYSYGICLWQMLRREKPYGNDNMYVVIFGVVSYKLRPDIDEEMERRHPSYIRLIRKCWKGEPSQRPTARDVILKLNTIKTNLISRHDVNYEQTKARWKF